MFTACKQPGSYFEGYVESSVSYAAKDSTLLYTFQYYYGHKLVTYYGKDGFISWDYVDSTGRIKFQEVFRPDSMKLYTIVPSMDTVYALDVAQRVDAHVLGIDKHTGIKILGHDVEKIRTKAVLTLQGETRKMNTAITYYNDVSYPVNPGMYERVEYNKTTDIYSMSPYITVKIVTKFEDRLTTTVTAQKVVRTDIVRNHFIIPKSATIIDLLKKQ